MVPFIILAVVVVVLAVLFMLGACKVASDSDDQSDALYDSLMREKEAPESNDPPPRHPSVARALGRVA